MRDPLLKIEGLNAFYGDVQVLWDVDLDVGAGEIVSVIGPNGSGKSTLLLSIMGMVKPRPGGVGPVICYDGQPIDGCAPEEVVKRGMCLVPEGARVFPEMTCMDNLKLGAYTVKDRHREFRLLEEITELFPKLKERAHQKARTLSGGERQMLAIARALMSEPRFLLLDEPSLGLHPLMVSDIFGNIERINRRGLPVLLVEQKVTFALKMSHRAYVMENGRVVMTGSGEDLLQNDHVRKAYLSV